MQRRTAPHTQEQARRLPHAYPPYFLLTTASMPTHRHAQSPESMRHRRNAGSPAAWLQQCRRRSPRLYFRGRAARIAIPHYLPPSCSAADIHATPDRHVTPRHVPAARPMLPAAVRCCRQITAICDATAGMMKRSPLSPLTPSLFCRQHFGIHGAISRTRQSARLRQA